MISNPDLVFYACIAKGPTVLVEYCSSKAPGIEEIGKRCIEKTPPHHSIFSHNIRQKTYTFLIRDPFVYFIIYDENLEKSESFWFLDRVKVAFEEFMASKSTIDLHNLTHLCFQNNFYPTLREILALDADLVNSFISVPKEIRTPSLDSTRTGTFARPLLPKPAKMMMKKKKRPLGCGSGGSDGGEGNGDHHHHNFRDFLGAIVDNKVNHGGNNGGIILNREFSVSMHKNGGGFYFGDSRQKAKQMWRKHVWVVLTLDLVICAVLFGIWLWVCRGFKCIDG